MRRRIWLPQFPLHSLWIWVALLLSAAAEAADVKRSAPTARGGSAGDQTTALGGNTMDGRPEPIAATDAMTSPQGVLQGGVVEGRELAYGSRKKHWDILSQMSEERVASMVLCSFYEKNPGTCNPIALHGPCSYCKVKNKLKLLGKAMIKGSCPGPESFSPGVTNLAWRLAETKFANQYRVCVVEEVPIVASDFALQDGGLYMSNANARLSFSVLAILACVHVLWP